MKKEARDYFFRDKFILCDLHDGIQGLHKKATKSVVKELDELSKALKPHLSDEVLAYHRSVLP